MEDQARDIAMAYNWAAETGRQEVVIESVGSVKEKLLAEVEAVGDGPCSPGFPGNKPFIL